MPTVVMPAHLPVSDSFSIADYRDVDSANDKATCFAYLDTFAALFREVSELSIDELRLRAGHAVLDVGCGHGASVAALARRVGSAARIVGVDASQAMLAEARRRFAHSNTALELRLGDATALPFENAAFDAARADRVFMFVQDPRQALAEMVRVTKPGGRIVVTEGDIGTHSIDATDAVMTRAVVAALSERSPNGLIGRRLRAMFIEAQLREVDLRVVPIVTTSFAEWNRRLGVEGFLSIAIEHRKLDRRKVTAWLDDLRSRDAAGRFTGTALLYLVAGTRPASSHVPAPSVVEL